MQVKWATLLAFGLGVLEVVRTMNLFSQNQDLKLLETLSFHFMFFKMETSQDLLKKRIVLQAMLENI